MRRYHIFGEGFMPHPLIGCGPPGLETTILEKPGYEAAAVQQRDKMASCFPAGINDLMNGQGDLVKIDFRFQFLVGHGFYPVLDLFLVTNDSPGDVPARRVIPVISPSQEGSPAFLLNQ